MGQKSIFYTEFYKFHNYISPKICKIWLGRKCLGYPHTEGVRLDSSIDTLTRSWLVVKVPGHHLLDRRSMQLTYLPYLKLQNLQSTLQIDINL